MANTVYGRLNFTYQSDYIRDFSSNSVQTLGQISPILKPWQKDTIAANTVIDLTYNPCANAINCIIAGCWQIVYCTSNIIGTYTSSSNTATYPFSTVSSIAYYMAANSGPNFLHHTNRMSDVEPPANTKPPKPHFVISTTMGKTIAYTVYQTDHIVNNSPILGSFTSLMIKDDLPYNCNTVLAIADAICGSMSAPITLVPDDPLLSSWNASTSSITNTQTITNYYDTLKQINDYYEQRMWADWKFYDNSVNVSNEIAKMKSYSEGGETVRYLINEFIGTPKLAELLKQDDKGELGIPHINIESNNPFIKSVKVYKPLDSKKHRIEVRYEGFVDWANLSFRGVWTEDLLFQAYGSGTKIFDIPLTNKYGILDAEFLEEPEGFSTQDTISYGMYDGTNWDPYPLLSVQITDDLLPWPLKIINAPPE